MTFDQQTERLFTLFTHHSQTLGQNLTSYAAADYGPAVYCDFWDTIFSKGCNVADFPVVCDY